MTTPIAKDVRDTLRTLFEDVTADVETWRLESAYQTAGGIMLNTATTRVGWPAADLFLEFALAVRALLRDNADVTARDRARAHYREVAARVQAALDAG